MPDADARNLDAMLEELAGNLRAQLALHRRLEACLDMKREAIRVAKIDALADICAEENDLLQQLGEREKARLALIGMFTETIAPASVAPLTISAIAAAVGSERAGASVILRDELRETVKRARRQSSVVRAAMESLNRHMIGILQTVRSALSGAGVYERKGQVSLGAQLDFSVDVRS